MIAGLTEDPITVSCPIEYVTPLLFMPPPLLCYMRAREAIEIALRRSIKGERPRAV